MKDTMDRLWDEYLVDECAKIDTDEQRRLAGRAAELGEAVSRLLSAEQGEALEAYVDSLLDAEAFYIKKAFFMGCELAISFLWNSGYTGH